MHLLDVLRTVDRVESEVSAGHLIIPAARKNLGVLDYAVRAGDTGGNVAAAASTEIRMNGAAQSSLTDSGETKLWAVAHVVEGVWAHAATSHAPTPPAVSEVFLRTKRGSPGGI